MKPHDEPFVQRLAEYLGGEMDRAEAERFRAELTADGGGEEPLAGLEATLAALRADLVPLEQAERDMAAYDVGAAPPLGLRSGRGGTILRLTRALGIAAMIAIGFAGGYFARGLGAPAAEPASNAVAGGAEAGELAIAGGRARGELDFAARVPVVIQDAAERFALAQQEFPKSSSFSHALLSLARR